PRFPYTTLFRSAGLHGRLRPGGLDGLGKPGQAIAADDEHVAHAAVGELGAHPGPELRALGGLQPYPEDVFDAVHVHAHGDVSGLVPHVGSVADLDHDRVQVDHRIQRVQRTRLPGQYLLSDLVGDVADRLVGQLGADRGHEMVLDVADGHPAGIQRDDHLVQAAEATITLGQQPRRETAVTIAWYRQIDVTDLRGRRLRTRTVTGVRELSSLRVALLITQMIGQLHLQAPLEGGLDETRDEAPIASQIDLASIDLGEQPVQSPTRRELRRSTRTRSIGTIGPPSSSIHLRHLSSICINSHSSHDPFLRTDPLLRPSDTPDEDVPDSLLSQQLAFWTKALDGAPEILSLPLDRLRPPLASHRGSYVPFHCSPQLHQQLNELARSNHSTLFMVL